MSGIDSTDKKKSQNVGKNKPYMKLLISRWNEDDPDGPYFASTLIKNQSPKTIFHSLDLIGDLSGVNFKILDLYAIEIFDSEIDQKIKEFMDDPDYPLYVLSEDGSKKIKVEN